MFNDARRLGLITTNPFAGLGIERSRGRRDLPSEWLTATDIDRLADTALRVHGEYGPVMAAMVTFAAYTGIRPGELFALDFADIDGSVLHVHRAADSRTRTITTPKNGHGRDVVLPRRAREAVDRMPRLYDQQAVFVAPRGGRLWAPHFNWLWNPVRAAFGRPTMAFHELRHFCATYLLERGLSPADVAVQLGHRDGGALVMSTYGHPSERAAKARILAAVDGPNPVKGIRRTA
jgi:integrase